MSPKQRKTRAVSYTHLDVYKRQILRNEYYSDIMYVFNFVSEREKKDVLELSLIHI